MHPLRINNNRIRIISNTIKDIGLEAIKRIEEYDPQFKALRKIHNRIKDLRFLCLAAICNAIISYRLSGHGEDYWLEFAEYLTYRNISLNVNADYIVDLVAEFLTKSKYNRMLLNQKISRLRRLKTHGVHRTIFDKCPELINNLSRLLVVIANGINAKPDSKTIVFAVKMAYYAARVHGKSIIPPMDIMIPVDRRIGLLSYTSGIIDLNTRITSVRDLERIVLRYSGIPREAWRRVSLEAGIPPLNIDSLIWFISRGLGRKNLLLIRRNAINVLLKILGEEYRSKIMRLVKEIYFRDIVEH